MIAKHRFKITFIILTLIFILIMRAMTADIFTAASNVPPLFINDFAYPYTHIQPVHVENGVHYIHITIFEFMRSSVTVDTRDNLTNDFIIRHGDRWIAFNISSGRAYDASGNDVPNGGALSIGRRGRDIYVPARAVANTIGLHVDISDAHGSIRIRDNTASLNFAELLQPYIITMPPAPTDPPPTPLPVTDPPTTPPPPTDLPTTTPDPTIPATTVPTTTPEPTTEPETTTPENTRDINNYLMFYDNAPDYISDKLGQVLAYLGDNNIRALFFMSGDEIRANPDKLRRIFALGHDIGIKIEHADFGDLLESVSEANAYIYSLVKQMTRFYIITDNLEYPDEYITELRRAGYYLCRENTGLNREDFEDTDSENIDLNIDLMIEFLKQQRANLFAFDLSDLDNNNLELIARASDIKFYINFSHINNANIAHLK